MASPPTIALALVLFLSLVHFPSVRGSPVECEELPQDLCAFSVSTQSKRCVLESAPRADGTTEYQCRTSEVRVEKLADWIETDECVRTCGVERESVGISSDSLLDQEFTAKLCSPRATRTAPTLSTSTSTSPPPKILFLTTASAFECAGAFLPDLCAARRSNPRRSMRGVALAPGSGPLDSIAFEDAPGPLGPEPTPGPTAPAPAVETIPPVAV
ncbi:unnamed protein product [Spirodela intermedia]|uniref:Uncharacterized protein n=1 Tax=Spirodela intermedia TaxID=51605 RepID=A0A7I8ICI8_SPIIN|nr:unnamed protein product [Spirodela intermedia]CAA6655074.1 unnamed protein product [Spirodela intermedia]